MRIVIHSNSPTTHSGYGQQTNLFSRLLTDAGHEVIVSAFHGLKGTSLNLGGVLILPGGVDAWGNDILATHCQVYDPDAVVALVDLWVLEPSLLDAVSLAAWAPIDHDPVPPAVAHRLKQARYQWAMSRFAEREMRRLGLDPFYVPHGVDTLAFAPGSRGEARRRWGIEDGTFFAVCVAANKGWPSRKSLDRLLKAWGRFCETRRNVLLYVHTHASDVYGGADLVEMAAYYGIPEGALRFADPYRLVRGSYDTQAMSQLYNAADALVLPSAGGGFEIPLIEAAACGCPVVTTKVTAMAELVGPGYGIDVDPFDGMAWSLQTSEQANVLPSQILTGIEWAYDQRKNTKLRAASREFALQYDARRILRDYMLPALEEQAADTEARRERTRQQTLRMAARDEERW